MSNINDNALYATLRDVSSGSLTIDDAMSRINDMTKKEMQYDPPETPIQESEVTALIIAQEGGPTASKQENYMSDTPTDDSTEITSKTYVDEVVKADEVPTPDVEAVEDTKRDEKVENPEDGPKEREPEEGAEEKPAYKNKRAERRAAKT